MNIKDRKLIYSTLNAAYGSSVIRSFGKPAENTFEYFLLRRETLEKIAEVLRSNLFDYIALIILKKELALFKQIYMKISGDKKIGLSDAQLDALNSAPIGKTLRLITSAEIAQYEQYFTDNPKCAYLPPKTLFQVNQITKIIRISTMVDIYRETMIGKYLPDGESSVSDIPDGSFVSDMLQKAYARTQISLPDMPEALEYYIECKRKIASYADALLADMTDYESLLGLKHDLPAYKIAGEFQHGVFKSRTGRRRIGDIRGSLLKTLSPENILYLIVKAEITQYEAFFENNPDAVYISASELLSRKRMLRRMREKTIADIYIQVYGAGEIKVKIAKSLLENPKELYPAARAMKRKFIIHSGMTNTGKTHNAIAALKKAKTGVYLGPLRLLALEIQENLLMDNVICSMVTGEEENIVPYATHVSSTVEMADLYAPYDTAVIDECQMIADDERGCAWTRAVLGVRAEEIHLCASPDAVQILIKIINDCGDDYEIIEYERRAPIEYDNSLDTGKQITWKNEKGLHRRPSCTERMEKIDIDKLEYGDAIIAFSRRDVLEIAELLREKGIKSSVVYGDLPYNARKNQLKRFTDGETKVVVATDAIGMGLNLPVRRVIFTTIYKFDGKLYRRLYPSEIKQIAGRAGRKGIYDKGYVFSVAEPEYVCSSLTCDPEIIERAYIDFDTEFLEIESDMQEILLAWSEAEMPYDIYEKINVRRIISRIKIIEAICEKRGMNAAKQICTDLRR